MVDITSRVEVTVSISAFDMGRKFAEMFSEDQAQFFNGVSAVVKGWPRPACFQWQAMRDDLERLPDALRCFKDIAEYGPDYTPEPPP